VTVREKGRGRRRGKEEALSQRRPPSLLAELPFVTPLSSAQKAFPLPSYHPREPPDPSPKILRT
jgi:hypothetical protein